MKVPEIRTRHALLIAMGLVTAGFVWATFMPAAPYETYVLGIGTIAGLYGGKRLAQKQARYSGKPVVMEGEDGVEDK